MVKKGIAVAAALAFAAMAATPAQAVTPIGFTFNLNSALPGGGSGLGNVKNYTSTQDGVTLNLQVSAWAINTSTNKIEAATVMPYSGGLGISSKYESTGSPQHSIDNSGKIEFLLFKFNEPVDLNSFYVGWDSGDADATVFYGDVTTNPTLAGMSKTTLYNTVMDGSYNSLVGSASAGLGQRNIANTETANWWIISALDKANASVGKNDPYDYFKVKSLKVDFFPVGPGVPEPSTWAMMIAGIGVAGAALRRRRALGLAGDVATA